MRAFILALTLLVPCVPTQAQTPSPSDHPITRRQVETYFDKSMILTASKQHIQDGLAKTRTTLPPWIPDSVWQDVKAQVDAIDFVGAVLPVYQRFFTEDDGAALILILEGPTGQAYAQAPMKSRLAAINQGLEGSAAESAAMNSDLEKEAMRLERKRIAELTPQELASFKSIGERRQLKIADGLNLDDEQNAVMQKKVNEVFRATLNAHHDELVKAQRAYETTHPPK